MDLKLIGNTVTNICEAIANVLDVDVIVVDRDLLIIGNTYKYMEENDIDVKGNSIMAASIFEMKNKVVMNINEFEKCRVCHTKSLCKIKGVISIPIVHENHILGAIGLMLDSKEKSEEFSKNLKGIEVFLENMSELLISKLMSVEQVNQIKVINHEIEHIITNVNDGIVYIDKDNKVSYCNNIFKEYFNITEDIISHRIEQIISHPIIRNYLFSKRNIKDEVFVLQNNSVNFKGLISCVNTHLNSEYLGSILTFRKIEETFRVMNEMLNNKSNVKMNQLICHDVDIADVVERAKKVAINDDNVLITGKREQVKKHWPTVYIIFLIEAHIML